MKKALFIIIAFVFQFCLIFGMARAQKGHIIFYKSYTDRSETNLYKKTTFKFDYKTQYESVKIANVKNELNNAINHKDYRFIAISGNSYLYPGLETDEIKNKKEFTKQTKRYRKYLDKYKFKVIEGTSDAINSQLPPLQTVVYHYTHQYNKLLLLKIEELEKKRR